MARYKIYVTDSDSMYIFIWQHTLSLHSQNFSEKEGRGRIFSREQAVLFDYLHCWLFLQCHTHNETAEDKKHDVLLPKKLKQSDKNLQQIFPNKNHKLNFIKYPLYK